MRGRGRRTSRTKPRQVRCFDAPAGAEQRGETVPMTATVVHLIGEEHRTIARLLDLIEREVSAFAAGETPDLDLLASILRYTQEYPDRFHHPKEDLIFRKLKERNSAAAATVDAVLQEHEAVGQYSEDFAKLIERL